MIFKRTTPVNCESELQKMVMFAVMLFVLRFELWFENVVRQEALRDWQEPTRIRFSSLDAVLLAKFGLFGERCEHQGQSLGSKFSD